MENKQKIYTIKVYEDVWDILTKMKQKLRMKSINDLLINYYQIKEDVQDDAAKS